MSESLSKIYLHLVFSTKQRIPFLKDNEIRNEIYHYMGGIIHRLNCLPVRIGGVSDHVHILFILGRDITSATVVKEVKRATSVWIKSRYPNLMSFGWQRGYAIFSVSVSMLAEVRQYVENQQMRHARVSYLDELRTLLKKHDVDFNERYLSE